MLLTFHMILPFYNLTKMLHGVIIPGMTNRQQNSFDKAYKEAFDLACKELGSRDTHNCFLNAGAEITNQSEKGFTARLTFLNKTVNINVPDFTFTGESEEPLHIWEKIMILHYLSNAVKCSPSGSLINYRQIRDGSTYVSTFEKRSTTPFTGVFANNPDLLPAAAKPLGGVKTEQGDVGIKIMAFPYVPVYFIIWRGDEEFPPSGSILFDESIETYLSAEDVAVLSQQIVFRLIKEKKLL